jgi:hypothetical protein
MMNRQQEDAAVRSLENPTAKNEAVCSSKVTAWFSDKRA